MAIVNPPYIQQRASTYFPGYFAEDIEGALIPDRSAAGTLSGEYAAMQQQLTKHIYRKATETYADPEAVMAYDASELPVPQEVRNWAVSVYRDYVARLREAAKAAVASGSDFETEWRRRNPRTPLPPPPKGARGELGTWPTIFLILLAAIIVAKQLK